MTHPDGRSPVSPWPAPAAVSRRFTVRYAAVARVGALVGALVYLVGISAYLLTHGGWPTPDYLIPPLLLIAISAGRGWAFFLDWAPFLFLVLSWQATAGVANHFGRPVHMTAPAHADMWLFHGTLPTVWLQDRMFDPARAHWYDWAATIQHALHFVLPVAIGVVIWLRSRRVFWRYVLSVMVVFYLGFAGYVLYPAAPPWMAGQHEIIPPVHRVAVETLQRFPAAAPIGLAYNRFSANEVAAMPSLHAAVPVLLALVLIRLYGRWALPALLYPLTMGFNLVYLGEHYVVDVLAGYAAGLAGYVAVWAVPDLLHLRTPRLVTAASAASRRAAAGMARLAGNPHLPPRFVPFVENGLLAAVAVASTAVIVSTLRPSRPHRVPGPVVPGLQVQAGQLAAIQPVPCDEGASPSLTVGNLMVPVTGNYAAYLFDLADGACWTLSANVSFPPPGPERAAALAARAPVELMPTTNSRRGIAYYTIRRGAPSQDLLDAGLPGDHDYVLIVLLGDVTDVQMASAAVDDVSAIVFAQSPEH